MESLVKLKRSTITSLHFVALIPDRELRIKVNAFKSDFKRFGCDKATKVYTYITLKAPFKCSGSDREDMLSWFSQMRLPQKPFHLYLNGFGAFHNKYSPVIFVNPVPSLDLLRMQRELMIGFNSILSTKVHPVDRAFKPHMTVAYRNLSTENFSLAWHEYKDKHFYDVFDVHSIYLMKHDTKKWKLVDTHKLG